ncbi:MAG: 4-hydroxybenzoate octaprenyltransferase [Thermodesulfobacteriota bacterium]
MSATTFTVKLEAISDIIRLRKQYGTVLLLCPALWSLFLVSGGKPAPGHLLIFILGAFLMRSAGCVVNDIADRNFDRHVERTMSRPLADGRLGVVEAAVIFVIFSLFAFILVLQLNRLTIMLSFVGLALAATYPLIKRVSHLPQAFLGMAFGWGAVMAWSAVTGTVELPAVLIFIANIFWAMSYDTIYALMDIDDDQKIGVKSTAILFGRHVYKILFVLNVAMIAVLAYAGSMAGLGRIFLAGLLISFALLTVILFILKRTPTREVAFKGFVANAAVGVLVLLSIILDMHF